MRAEAGPYVASSIAQACKGVLLRGKPHEAFDAISTDSRDIKQNDLFVPLRGPNFNGHHFLLPALEAGARGSLVDRDVDREIFNNHTNHVLIQVKDTLQALSDLASAHRKTYTSPLIAVTGSSGKTTVKEMIAAVLGRSHHPLVSYGNLNNMIGLPMTVLNLRGEHDVTVVEAGINMMGEMEHLAKAASPNIAVITTIGPVHLEGLGSLETVAIEKFKLVRALPLNGTAVLPANDTYLEPLVGESPCRVWSFGIDDGDFRASNIQTGLESRFELITPMGNQEIMLPLAGRHNVANALAAAAACVAMGCPLPVVAEGLRSFTPPTWRMEVVGIPGDRLLIRDCYNANPQSMKAALQVLAERGLGGPTLAILADMMELGAHAESLHREVGREAARLGIDRVVFVGAYGESFGRGFVEADGNQESFVTAQDNEEAWKIMKPGIGAFRTILVKGSRVMKMETMVDRILEET